jgi:hypothetical protein
MVLFVSSTVAWECHKMQFILDCIFKGIPEISQIYNDETKAEEAEPSYSFGCADFLNKNSLLHCGKY